VPCRSGHSPARTRPALAAAHSWKHGVQHSSCGPEASATAGAACARICPQLQPAPRGVPVLLRSGRAAGALCSMREISAYLVPSLTVLVGKLEGAERRQLDDLAEHFAKGRGTFRPRLVRAFYDLFFKKYFDLQVPTGSVRQCAEPLLCILPPTTRVIACTAALLQSVRVQTWLHREHILHTFSVDWGCRRHGQFASQGRQVGTFNVPQRQSSTYAQCLCSYAHGRGRYSPRTAAQTRSHCTRGQAGCVLHALTLWRICASAITTRSSTGA
jgi:hypothetical protein